MAETFGDFRLEIGEPGVRRQNRMHEKPGFSAYSRVSWGAWPNAGMAGWRRSADRACLQSKSLQTGNFTGKLAILVARRQDLLPKNAAMQRLLRQFPTLTNREMIVG
jgi:hypothetical protein